MRTRTIFAWALRQSCLAHDLAGQLAMPISGIVAMVTVLTCHRTTGHEPTGHPWMLTFGALLIIAAGSWLYRIPEPATELAGIARGGSRRSPQSMIPSCQPDCGTGGSRSGRSAPRGSTPSKPRNTTSATSPSAASWRLNRRSFWRY